jgi:hypothetical protein
MKPVLLVIALVASAAALVLSAPASSYSVKGTGSPGTTSTPFTFGTFDPWGSKITVPWRWVHESPAFRGYDQRVCVTPRLWTIRQGIFPRWALSTSRTSCASIPAASSSVKVDGADFTSIIPYSGYSVDIRVTWQLANGRLIGTRTYDYRDLADYRCNVGAPRCIVEMTNWGGGAFMMFDW